MTILYSCIARSPDTVLCSHQDESGNFTDIVRSILPNIPTRTDSKTTYTSNNYMFHVIVENGLIYLCASNPDLGRLQPYAYLTEIKRQFTAGSLGSRAHFENDGALDVDFAPVLTQQMDRFSNPQSGDQLTVLQAQVQDVTGIMTQNIEKVMQRGENLDELMDKTTDLEAHSATFKKTAGTVHRKMFWKNMKMTILLICVVIVVLTVIVLIICFSTGVFSSGSSGGGGDDKTTTTTTTQTPPVTAQ